MTLAQLAQRIELLTHAIEVLGSILLAVSILNSVKTRETQCDDRFVVNAVLTHIVVPYKEGVYMRLTSPSHPAWVHYVSTTPAAHAEAEVQGRLHRPPAVPPRLHRSTAAGAVSAGQGITP